MTSSPQVPEPVWSASAAKYLCPVMGCLFREKMYWTMVNHIRMHFDCSYAQEPADKVEEDE